MAAADAKTNNNARREKTRFHVSILLKRTAWSWSGQSIGCGRPSLQDLCVPDLQAHRPAMCQKA